VADGNGTLYVVMQDVPGSVAVVDTKTMKATAHYPLGDAGRCNGLALDAKNPQLAARLLATFKSWRALESTRRALAEAALAAGWYLSFSGIITFKKWTDDDLLRLVPENRLLVESDSPYLAPVPFRGKRNEPAWVAHTVARLAAARGGNPRDIGAATAANTERLFGLALEATQ
jgi:hypothetical protein